MNCDCEATRIHSQKIQSPIESEANRYSIEYAKFWKSCINNDHKFVKKICKINGFDLEVKTKEGWTALIMAVYNGSNECVEVLINSGADVNAKNYNLTNVLE